MVKSKEVYEVVPCYSWIRTLCKVEERVPDKECACLQHVQAARKRVGEDPGVSRRIQQSQELALCSGHSHHKILKSLLDRDRRTFSVGL